ncbi:MAG: glycosyltransferase [Gammaproteobacteria bacterium]
MREVTRPVSAGSRLAVVVTGYVVRMPVGGLFWHYVQYLLGLRALGHEVFFVEDSEGLRGQPAEGLAYAARAFARLDLDDSWAFFDHHTGSWQGGGAARVRDFVARADLLLNVSCSTSLHDFLDVIPRRVLIDTDPAFTQAKLRALPGLLERVLHHQRFFTFGESLPRAIDPDLDDGLPWLPTRQPIALDHWEATGATGRGVLTTVMSWRSYDPIVVGDRTLGVKEASFAPYRELPASSPLPLEIALDAESEVKTLLQAQGWKIVDAPAVSTDPWAYQDYVATSMGEFSVAKEAYVVADTGWFSERSACYLASGRPVVTQDTGFPRWLGGDRGVLTFSDRDEALAQLERLAGDYARQSAAAREVAEACFDAPRVLASLLERAWSEDGGSAADGLAAQARSALGRFRGHASIVARVTPEDARLIVLDDGAWWIHGSFAGRSCLPFLERRGQPWGRPRDDAHAIAELERMRDEGAEFLVVAPEAQWWTKCWSGLAHHLVGHYRLLVERDGLTVWQLAGNP